MSRILAVDTTHEYGSLALLDGEQLVEELELHAPNGFAHVLYHHLGALLTRHGWKAADIDLFAGASGPGSFTGVRVGLACIKGLAEAVGRPAVAISNLQAISTFGVAPWRAAVMDARRGEIYGGLYDENAGLMTPEVVAQFPVWLETLPVGVEFVALDFTPPVANVRFAPRALAAAIARLASRAEPQDPAALDANYVRRSDAELFWKE